MLEKCFLFEGQGGQHPGMGKDIIENYFAAGETFDVGRDITGVDLRRLCFDTDADELNKTHNSQLAVFALSMAIFNTVKQCGFTPSVYAGFSLGECSALCAAGVFSLENGFKIVKKRGELMHSSALKEQGAMYAIIGLEDDAVEKVCKETEGFVIAANYNCPLQVVIAGDEKSAEFAAERCMDIGAKRAVRLSVEGAFHTKHMASAAQEFKEFLKGFTFNLPKGAVYSNISAEKITDYSDIPGHLSRHIISPVRWKDEISAIIAAGTNISFYEIGCGSTLTQFNRRINKMAVTKSLSTVSAIGEVLP